MRTSIVLSAFAGLVFLTGGPVIQVTLEDNSPRLFSPGVISGAADDMSPAFSPDGRMVFFTRSNASSSTIMMSWLRNGHWSTPAIAPFSGEWRDLEASMAPDGSYLVFASNRPATGNGKPLDGHYSGRTVDAGGGNLWKVERQGTTWGTPTRLPDSINQGTSVFSPSISANGSLYFMKPDSAGRFHILRSQYQAGTFLAPTLVAVGDSTTDEVDPAVAPDESFIVYSSSHPSQKDPKRLFIALAGSNGWDRPQDLGDEVNETGGNIEARLSPNHLNLYFSTNTVPPTTFPRSRDYAQRELAEMTVWANGRENIWFASLAPWLNTR